MTSAPTTNTADSSSPSLASAGIASRFLPLLLILFIGSGCCALIYEVVWFQLLQLVIGSSAVSIGVLLGTFMGGMCLGSLLFHRLVPLRWHPLRVYALLEMGIGLVAIGVTLGMPILDRLYISYATPGMQPGMGAILFRGLVCALCLLPPTLLMGATLPAIARWIQTTPRGVSWLGFFYGGNTAGAVIGCLMAGFWLLRVFDMTFATYVAAAINLFVALMALSLSVSTSYRPTVQGADAPADTDGKAPLSVAARVLVYLAIAFSGMSALGAEVVWTRLLSLLLGGTVYTFSIILAVFLFGLGVGSSIGAMLSRGPREGGGAGIRPRIALGWCQVFLCAGIAWSAISITRLLPQWPVSQAVSTGLSFRFQLDLARCLWAILPPTIMWGASFPLALAAVVTRQADPARVVGRVYAANTIGAICGALLFSMVLIPHFGTQRSEHFLIAMAGAAALLALFPLEDTFSSPASTAGSSSRSGSGIAVFATLLASVAVPMGLIFWLNTTAYDALPGKLVAWGRSMLTEDVTTDNKDDNSVHYLYVGEGMNSSVAVTQLSDGARRFHVSGKVEASSLPEDMRLQLMLGHFPALFHKNPESVLIVGCGAGVTAGCFVLHPEVKHIVICEIEPLIPQVVATYFGNENNQIVSRDTHGKLLDPRVTIVYDDARHFMLTTREKFDIITSDPIHPWVKGAATLYTKEYFDLCKQHLNEGGLVTQWVPLYESSESTVKSEIATFFQAFPGGSVWNNDVGGAGYDSMVLGCKGNLQIDADTLQDRFNLHPLVARYLEDAGFKSAQDILLTYAGRDQDLRDWTQNAQINYDRNLRLQYLAGESLNAVDASAIRDHIVAYRTFPQGLIKGTDELRQKLSPACDATGENRAIRRFYSAELAVHHA